MGERGLREQASERETDLLDFFVVVNTLIQQR
jgi:hypothetical protein